MEFDDMHLMDYYGKWKTISELGRGGQGVVYIARDTTRIDSREEKLKRIKEELDRLAFMMEPERPDRFLELLSAAVGELASGPVDPSTLGAVKALHQPTENRSQFEKAKERMNREVAALSKIDHPNVLKILDQDITSGWFVGEYHSEGPVSKYPSLFKGNVLLALQAFRPLVEGVVLLHQAKIVHRDIKPDNVFIGTDKRLVLGDLGLVLFTDATHTRITASYENVGSRDWMPAWAMGMRLEEVRPSFDVFCLGKLLWALLSGRTFLRLWYLHDDDFELEKMFPDKEAVTWARVILDRCIVEKEKDCLQTAEELLVLVDEVLSAVERHAQIVGDGIPRRCRVCGSGTYNSIANEDTTALRTLGLVPSPSGGQTYKVFSCSNCGHVQMFHIANPQSSRPKAWLRS